MRTAPWLWLPEPGERGADENRGDQSPSAASHSTGRALTAVESALIRITGPDDSGLDRALTRSGTRAHDPSEPAARTLYQRAGGTTAWSQLSPPPKGKVKRPCVSCRWSYWRSRTFHRHRAVDADHRVAAAFHFRRLRAGAPRLPRPCAAFPMTALQPNRLYSCTFCSPPYQSCLEILGKDAPSLSVTASFCPTHGARETGPDDGGPPAWG
jgi:hypothetical protein